MKTAVLCVLAACAVAVRGGVLLHVPACPQPLGVQTYPHPELCDHFFMCTNGTVTLETCGNGLLYDGKGAVHHHCNYHWAVECGDRKADLTPVSSPGCLYQYGLYPASTTCSTTYVKCVEGVPEGAACEPGLVYDDRSHSCNWPDLLLDSCNPEAVVGFKCPHPPPVAAARFWPFPRYPLPGDCGRLITCVAGHPRLISCGEGKAFDDATLTCEDADLVPKCANYLKK